MKQISVVIIAIFSFQLSYGQVYSDFIGAGHSIGIQVTTSSHEGTAQGVNTINGRGMDARLFEASRFLTHAAFGGSISDIESLSADLDFEGWIDNQVTIPQTVYLESMNEIWEELLDLYADIGIGEDDLFGPWSLHFNYALWQNVVTGDDVLRQKVAMALSELLVISSESDIGGWGEGLSSYYDILMTHAFGNYKDMLVDVSLHPMMGHYLSHYNNPLAMPEDNIHPDENYAREIMQLFSIGLYELNMDGTEKLDANGDLIPTYDNDDIRELAKVFTGLGAGALEPWIDFWDEPFFGLGMWGCEKTTPMIMYQDWHEPSEKIILGELTIPAGQAGMDDIDQAIDFLFNHDNVPPFVAKHMIQRLTKSNPSPAYIERVAMAFEDNGSGVRGDMLAVVKAVLLDEEIRSCAGFNMDDSGRMRAPTLRFANLARSINLIAPTERYWHNGFSLRNETLHHPMMSPTVFNFYLPNHQPIGPLLDADLVSPEMQIHNTVTATGYINSVNSWLNWGSLMNNWENLTTDNDGDGEDDFPDPAPPVYVDWDDFTDLANDPEALINTYDIIFTSGQLSDETRTFIRESVEGIDYPWNDDDEARNLDRAQLGLYLLLISPDYVIFK